MIDISVVVPCYNASQSLGPCLEALSRQTVPRQNYEVIVLDDGSADETPSVAERLGVEIVRREHAGPAAAGNCGAEQAPGEDTSLHRS